MNTNHPLPHERNLILGLLLVLATAAWVILIWQARAQTGTSGGVAGEMQGMPMELTMGMNAPLFLALWVVMMVAMMFPTAAPMILMFSQVAASKRQRGRAFVPTWIFVAGYMVIWTGFGVLAYLLGLGAEWLAGQSVWFMQYGARIGGMLLVLAGLYQLSPWKEVCLSGCRTPFHFVLHSWRDSYDGAFRMGIDHGLLCLGCCWLLFLILFPLGMMNVAAMAVITLLIFAEKSLSQGRVIGRIAAVVLITYGVTAIIWPAALPVVG